MQINNFFKTRGDTLIEVLFAITIFSLVAVGSLSIMNQGTDTSQRALEITMVRNEIDAQAESLRFMNASYISAFRQGGVYSASTPAGQWSGIMASVASTQPASDFGSITTCPSSSSLPTRPGSFIIDTHNAKYVALTASNYESAQTFSQVRYDTSDLLSHADGIWIEAVSSPIDNNNNQETAGYVDFHIRACWDSPGQPIPVTIGTIVRLYEPR